MTRLGVVRAVLYEDRSDGSGYIEVRIPDGWGILGFTLPVDHRGRFPRIDLCHHG